LIRTVPGRDAIQECLVDKVMGGVGQRHVQCQHVACDGETGKVGRRDLGRRRADRVVGQQPHAERLGELADSLPNSPVADDAHRRALQITDRHCDPFRPPALADEFGQRRQTLDQVQCQREYSLGDCASPAARRDDDWDASAGCRGEVDEVDADTGTCEDAQPRSPVQEGCVDDGVRSHDRTDGTGEVVRAGIGDQGEAGAENVGDQPGIYRSESDDDGTIDFHVLTRRRRSRQAPSEPVATNRSRLTRLLPR
jgi:hypothetical protein